MLPGLLGNKAIIVPTSAVNAGTMISLILDCVIASEPEEELIYEYPDKICFSSFEGGL